LSCLGNLLKVPVCNPMLLAENFAAYYNYHFDIYICPFLEICVCVLSVVTVPRSWLLRFDYELITAFMSWL
jgi:hypothetical protein